VGRALFAHSKLALFASAQIHSLLSLSTLDPEIPPLDQPRERSISCCLVRSFPAIPVEIRLARPSACRGWRTGLDGFVSCQLAV